MIITTAIVAAISACAGALAEDLLLLREQKKQGYVHILGRCYTIAPQKLATPVSLEGILRCNACGKNHGSNDLTAPKDGKQLYMTLLKCKHCGGHVFTKLETAA